MVKIQARTLEFAVRIVRLHKALAKSNETARIVGRQLLRSGTSIGANLEEAGAGESRKDFVHKCMIALKEAKETRYWLRLLIATEIMQEDKLDPLTQECTEIIAILTTIIKKTKSNSTLA